MLRLKDPALGTPDEPLCQEFSLYPVAECEDGVFVIHPLVLREAKNGESLGPHGEVPKS